MFFLTFSAAALATAKAASKRTNGETKRTPGDAASRSTSSSQPVLVLGPETNAEAPTNIVRRPKIESPMSLEWIEVGPLLA